MSTKLAEMEETEEFHVLRPFCIAIIQNPSSTSFKNFQKALSELPSPPQHLAEYVLFPFALHLKMIQKYKENLRISLFSCMADVLDKFEISSWDMFIEIFQRFHLALGSKEDPTVVSPKLSDEELEFLILCVLATTKRSLGVHFDKLFDGAKIQILAHSVFLVLQVINLDAPKKSRLLAMKVIETYVSVCEGQRSASRNFFKFLPGIVSSLRKTITVKGGRIYQELIVNGLNLLQKTVIICIAYEDEKDLEVPDLSLSPVFSELSNELCLHENVTYRKAITRFSILLLEALNGKMELCKGVLNNNLLVMRFDSDPEISGVISKYFSKLGNYSLCVSYDSIISTLTEALSQLAAGDDKMCELNLRRLSTYLTLIKLNFVELRGLLSILFNLVTEVNKSCDSVVTSEKSFKAEVKVNLCVTLCRSLTQVGNVDDILEEFDSVFSSFQGDVESSFLGSVFCFNQILIAYQNLSEICREISEYEIMQFAGTFLALLDMQSTSIVLSVLESEAPKVQSLVDVRKAYLLEGLGIMGQMCSNVLTIVLYPLVEYSGLKDSDVVGRSANDALLRLSNPVSLKEFLANHLSEVMNELSVRILNLSLHPNCPNALIFLAEYFDFRQAEFVRLIDQVLSRSCDPFCGGHLQHIYVKVFYSFMLSLWKHQIAQPPAEIKDCRFLSSKPKKLSGLMHRLIKYQNSIGMDPNTDCKNKSFEKDDEKVECGVPETEIENETDEIKALIPELKLSLQIAHRVLNFLSNDERGVRLLSMDCLIKGFIILQNHEDSLLPLAHTVWQFLIPRLSEKDYVVVRKSFELLLTICNTSRSFLKKRIVEEVFPILSTMLMNLASESEQVKNKNRQYYTYTQAYKLQLTILQGMSQLCDAIDIREEELDKVMDGCIAYLKPQQHKNLKEASLKLIESLVSRDNSRCVWMKLVSLGLRSVPHSSHDSFIPVPSSFLIK